MKIKLGKMKMKKKNTLFFPSDLMNTVKTTELYTLKW